MRLVELGGYYVNPDLVAFLHAVSGDTCITFAATEPHSNLSIIVEGDVDKVAAKLMAAPKVRRGGK